MVSTDLSGSKEHHHQSTIMIYYSATHKTQSARTPKAYKVTAIEKSNMEKLSNCYYFFLNLCSSLTTVASCKQTTTQADQLRIY